MKRNIGLGLLTVSILCLVAGLTYPFMTLKIEVEMKGGSGFFDSLLGGSISEQINQSMTYNIPQAMDMLFKEKQYFVGILIGLFALVVPILKTLMTGYYLYKPNSTLHSFMGSFGKFAMADVFCVGIFVAFLYTRFNSAIHANIETGYYWFTAYVVLNIISMMLISPSNQYPPAEKKENQPLT